MCYNFALGVVCSEIVKLKYVLLVVWFFSKLKLSQCDKISLFADVETILLSYYLNQLLIADYFLGGIVFVLWELEFLLNQIT